MSTRLRTRAPLRGASIAASLLSALCVVLVPGDAAAYTIDSVATASCHEDISADALRAVRNHLATAAPLPSTGSDDAALIDDVAFNIPDGMSDIGGTTFLLGIRDNDVKDSSPTALDRLAELNSDPSGQREHCLRTDTQKEPDGSRAAVLDCRTFIHDTLVASLEGLGPDGAPDPNKREVLAVSLAIRGRVEVPVPMFYLRAGRALHAIEDSFTHTFRAKNDRHKITVVLNWINYADGSLNEATDGPPHITGMDRCDNPDPLLAERRALATEAGTEALTAVLDPALSPAQKEAAITAMLDKFITYDETSACTKGNNWCDAAENGYRPKGCGCEAAGAPMSRGAWLGGLAIAAAFGLRRRRGKRAGRGPALVALGAALGGAFVASEARTQNAGPRPHAPRASASGSARPAASFERESLTPGASGSASAPPAASSPVPVVAASTPPPPSSAAPVPVVVPDDAPTHETKGPLAALAGESKAAIPGTVDPGGAFFGRVSGGIAYDHPAMDVGIGARYQLGKPWMVGLDAEWNPWFTTSPKKIRSGTANFYASLIRRYQLAYELVNFRSTVSLGASYLLSNLVGAERGSIGPFLGLSFLGVEFKVARGFFLTVDPTYIAFPVPHITGAPFGYYQYRFQVGLEFGGLPPTQRNVRPREPSSLRRAASRRSPVVEQPIESGTSISVETNSNSPSVHEKSS